MNNSIDLNYFNHKWFSFYHHTSFVHPDKDTCLKNINEEINNSAKFLKNTDFIFITFGTARIYEYKKSKQIVSNCHKIPANEFDHKLLSIGQIVEIYEKLTPKAKKAGIPIKSPELIQSILDDAKEIIKVEHVLITETKHGFICANAGIDKSNVEAENSITLLPIFT